MPFSPNVRKNPVFSQSPNLPYDGDGLRAWKQNTSGKTYFLYDGSQPVVEETNTNTFVAANTFGADGLASRHTTATTCYTFDERGNVSQRTSRLDKTGRLC